MTAWLRRWWRRSTRTVDRVLLLANLVVRVAVMLLVLAGAAGTARLFPGPGRPIALGAGLEIESGLLIWLWLRSGRVPAWSLLAVDVPVLSTAIVLSCWLTPHQYFGTLANYGYGVAMLSTLALGAAVRRPVSAVLAALPYVGAYYLGCRVAGEPFRLGMIAANLINPIVGWACASQLRRTSAELAEAQQDELASAVALATQQERARHARALHDRVLQTMETLSRPGWITDPALREEVATQAAWLRTFVQTGQSDQAEDLSTGLAAAARSAYRAGLRVELNDASLRLPADPGPVLDERRRDALIDATHQVLSALAGHTASVVVRAAPDADGIQVTVLATSRAEQPDPDAVAQAAARVGEVGGTLRHEPVPYVELWVPPGGPAAS
ncbi:MAG: hypothetical protein V7637_225 [Mycobacteriales bacterium]